MECDTRSCKYIVIDYNVYNFLDLNGWPKEVRILAVKGLEKVFDTDCLLFDRENSLSIEDTIKVFDDRHMHYKEV